MITIWNYRGDHRALWAVIASIVASYVLAMRLARWGESWQWVPLALPVAVLLIWFFLARAGVRDLGFPARGDRSSAAAGPLGGAVALLAGAVGAGLVAYGVLGGAGAAELPGIGAGSSEESSGSGVGSSEEAFGNGVGPEVSKAALLLAALTSTKSCVSAHRTRPSHCLRGPLMELDFT